MQRRGAAFQQNRYPEPESAIFRTMIVHDLFDSRLTNPSAYDVLEDHHPRAQPSQSQSETGLDASAGVS